METYRVIRAQDQTGLLEAVVAPDPIVCGVGWGVKISKLEPSFTSDKVASYTTRKK